MSVFRTLALAAALSVGLSGAAFARDIFTVKLEQPVAQQTQVVAQNAVWLCDGDTCLARPDRARATVRGCRQFVREAGARVVSYGSETDQLTAEEIATCNGDTPVAIQAQN